MQIKIENRRVDLQENLAWTLTEKTEKTSGKETLENEDISTIWQWVNEIESQLMTFAQYWLVSASLFPFYPRI